VRAVLATLFLLVTATPAGASELARAETLEPAAEPKRPYYGWQNIVVGYTGQLLLVHGFVSESPMIMVVGAATYGFGGAIVHGTHGNTLAAAVSPLIMLGFPVAMLFLASEARSSNEEALVGVAAAYVLGAPVIDSLLGYEPSPESPRVTIAPTVRRDAFGLSLRGAF